MTPAAPSAAAAEGAVTTKEKPLLGAAIVRRCILANFYCVYSGLRTRLENSVFGTAAL